jgi:hypothetical protein
LIIEEETLNAAVVQCRSVDDLAGGSSAMRSMLGNGGEAAK